MSQTSGSIVIETSGIASAVIEGLRPTLEQISAALSVQGQQADLSFQESVDAITSWGMTEAQASGLVGHLSNEGLMLIRVTPPDAVTAELDAAALKLRREDQWFRDAAES